MHRLARAAGRMLGLGALCALLGGPSRVQAADSGSVFAVVCSPDVAITDLSLLDVRRLMLGERRFWSANAPATALMPTMGSPSRQFLFEAVFHMNERSYRRHTLEQLYRGEIDYAPLVVGSADEALAFVAAGHGAVTIVPLDRLGRSNVHVLRVEGRLPQEPGYPLAR